jgi:hypothetical protein
LAGLQFSLSLRERAGVRGNMAAELAQRWKYRYLLATALGFLGLWIMPTKIFGIEVPISIVDDQLRVQTAVNGSEPLTFKLDTGFSITTIHPRLVGPLKLQENGHTTIIGIAGDEEATTYGGAVFDFGGMHYEPRRVAVLPSDGRRRRNRDGILGAGFFRRFVVELDFTRKTMQLHEPEEFTYAGPGEVFPLEFKKATPIVAAAIVLPGREAISGKFEIDTGCDDCVCFGHEFVAANRLLEGTNSVAGDVRRGVGGSAQVKHGSVDELRLGNLIVKKPSANFFLEGSPAGDGQAGHIGLGTLQRFKVIFDYSRKRMVLEPRS